MKKPEKPKKILYNGTKSYIAYRFYEGVDARFDNRPFTPSDEVCITRSLNVAFEDARDSSLKEAIPSKEELYLFEQNHKWKTREEKADALHKLLCERLGIKEGE